MLQWIRVSEEKETSVITRCITVLSLICRAQSRVVLSASQCLYYSRGRSVTPTLYMACVTGTWKFYQYSTTHTHTHTNTHAGKLVPFFWIVMRRSSLLYLCVTL